jgi:hypothetical protein
MPGGCIDRALTLKSTSFDYLAVNLMDLARYQARFGETGVVADVMREGMIFAERSGILGRYAELDSERYALGFWAEALYFKCLVDRSPQWRHKLADAVQVLDTLGLGMPPSLLGANGEAVGKEHQWPCPQSPSEELRMVNLSGMQGREVVVVNVFRRPVSLPPEFLDRYGLSLVDTQGDKAGPEAMSASRAILRDRARPTVGAHAYG